MIFFSVYFSQQFAWLYLCELWILVFRNGDCTNLLLEQIQVNSYILMGVIVSLISTLFSKGLGFRPLPPDDNVESTLIWYRGSSRENYRFWKESLDAFLHSKIIIQIYHKFDINFFNLILAYKTPGSVSGRGQNIYNCDYGQNPPRGEIIYKQIECFINFHWNFRPSLWFRYSKVGSMHKRKWIFLSQEFAMHFPQA